MAPKIIAYIKSVNKIQIVTNVTSEGIVVIMEIIVPLSKISRFVSFMDFSPSDNN